jgi:hypothetical protein
MLSASQSSPRSHCSCGQLSAKFRHRDRTNPLLAHRRHHAACIAALGISAGDDGLLVHLKRIVARSVITLGLPVLTGIWTVESPILNEPVAALMEPSFVKQGFVNVTPTRAFHSGSVSTLIKGGPEIVYCIETGLCPAGVSRREGL